MNSPIKSHTQSIPRVLVILSGGLDSTVLLHHLHKDAFDVVGAVSINYGQRHGRELQCAARTCAALGVPHFLVDLSSLGDFLSASALTCGDDGHGVPHGHYAAETMKATVVPNRNMILMSIAAGIAINNGASFIAYGAHSGDHAIYPDCRPAFADAMETALQLCHEPPVSVLRPFITWTKAQIVARGAELGVDFAETYTCYEGTPIACGRCGTCVERLEAFDACGLRDKFPYKDRKYWKSVCGVGMVGTVTGRFIHPDGTSTQDPDPGTGAMRYVGETVTGRHTTRTPDLNPEDIEGPPLHVSSGLDACGGPIEQGTCEICDGPHATERCPSNGFNGGPHN